MTNLIYSSLIDKKKAGKKSFAVLIDPDKTDNRKISELTQLAGEAKVDYLLVGGSLMVTNHLDETINQIKRQSPIPVILFPGTPSQVSRYADGLLYLSLISGRNPDLLIGQHVVSAPMVRQSGLEVIATGYMLIDGGAPTTVSYISNSSSIPANKNEIAVCTAMAGEMLGMKTIYMDAGSGAVFPVSQSMIMAVSRAISLPLIVGGGIKDPETAYLSGKAGADLVVVGNAIEKDASLIKEMSAAVHSVPVRI